MIASVKAVAPPVPTTHRFSVHSALEFEVRGTCAAAVDGIARDFWFFRDRSPSAPRLRVILDLEAPDYASLPPLPAAYCTPRNAVYHHGSRRILDFGGRGLAVLDEAAGTFSVRSLDPHLVYEAAYLFLLARIGEACERRGLVRLHALAAETRGRALLVVLPMGGGKSTLGQALLAGDDAVRILSDDSPLIDRRARAHAFPLHLGLLGAPDGRVPARFVRRIERMEFGPKFLVDAEWFGDRITPAADAGWLVVGRRTLAARPRLRRASYRETMTALLPAMILGVGLFQGLEFLLRTGVGDLVRRGGSLARRLRTAHGLARRSERWVLELGRDVAANAAALRELTGRRPPSG